MPICHAANDEKSLGIECPSFGISLMRNSAIWLLTQCVLTTKLPDTYLQPNLLWPPLNRLLYLCQQVIG